jgi:hypothetical protein
VKLCEGEGEEELSRKLYMYSKPGNPQGNIYLDSRTVDDATRVLGCGSACCLRVASAAARK